MQNFPIYLVSILTFLFFTACSTTIEHNTANDSVRKLTPDGAVDCKFLGIGKVSHITGFGEYDRIGNTYDITRKDVMSQGGNAYVGNMITGNPYVTNIRYEIYKCPR